MTDGPAPTKEAAFFTTIRGWGLTRGDHGVIGGVVSGLGTRIGMAPVPARLITVLAALVVPGVIVLAYAAAWGLLPDRRGAIIIQNFGRGVTNVGALLGIGAMALIGLIGLDWGPLFNVWDGSIGPFGVNWGGGQIGGLWDLLGPLAVLVALGVAGGVIVLVVVLITRSKKDSTGTAPSGTAPESGAAAPSGEATPESPGIPTDGDSATPESAPAADVTAAPASAQPEPWQHALLPGDPRAGVAPSRGAVAGLAAASAATANPTPTQPGASWHGAGAPPQAGGWAPSQAPASASVPPPGAGAPRPPSAPPRPPRPRVPGPGKGAWLAFLGVLLLSAAVVFALDRADEVAVSPLLAWGAGVTIGLGAILLVVALAGRRLGFLGFVSVVAALLSVLLAANADGIRTNFADRDRWDFWHDSVWDEPAIAQSASEPEPAPATTPIDLTAQLAASYGSTYAAGACTTPVLMETWEDVSLGAEDTATMRLDQVAADTAIDLTATYTRVAFPAGTGLEILGNGATTVVWEDRDVLCRDWGSGTVDDGGERSDESTTVLRATNPDEPVLTLTGRDGSVIYLEEVDQ